MPNRINPGISDLFFNHQCVAYDSLYARGPGVAGVTEAMQREALAKDAAYFLVMLQAAGVVGVTADALVEDFMGRL